MKILTSTRKAVKSLWRRSSLWRFFAISALVLTVVFALFPPPEMEGRPSRTSKWFTSQPKRPAAAVKGYAVAGLPIRLGDSIEQAQEELQTNIPPTVTRNWPFNGDTDVLGIHLKTRGIWAFFDSSGDIYVIRLNVPFAGNVAGLQVGDNLDKVKSILGEPLQPPTPYGRKSTYIYVLDDVTTLRIDIDQSGTIDTFVLIK